MARVYGSVRTENHTSGCLRKAVSRQGTSNVTVVAETGDVKAEVVMWHDGRTEFVLKVQTCVVASLTYPSPGGH